jgi:hypothetical protein
VLRCATDVAAGGLWRGGVGHLLLGLAPWWREGLS